MQQPAQFGRLALRRYLAELVEPGIKQAPLTNGPIGQLRGQGPVLATQGLALQFPLQGAVGVGPRRHGLQHLPGHLAGRQTDRLASHRAIGSGRRRVSCRTGL